MIQITESHCEQHGRSYRSFSEELSPSRYLDLINFYTYLFARGTPESPGGHSTELQQFPNYKYVNPQTQVFNQHKHLTSLKINKKLDFTV